MSCDDVAAAILDEGLARPADFQAHLDQCPRCRELARLHASASELRLPGPPPLVPISRQAIMGEVSRRQQLRRTAAGIGAAGAIAAMALLVMPRQVPTEPARHVPSVEVAEPASIELLLEEVEGYTQRDLTIDDESYAPFGTLALWVRPSASTALDERPFRTALEPLHLPSPTQEPSR